MNSDTTNEASAPSTAELLVRIHEAARVDPTHDGDARWDVLRALWHRRAEVEVFEAARAWSRSAEVFERVLGADLLGQLSQTPPDEAALWAGASRPDLLRLVSDPEAAVVASAVTALGHLKWAAEVAWEASTLRELARHPSENVRFALAVALHGVPHDPEGAEAEVLMALMCDVDVDVRDWATFSLAQGPADSNAVREAFVARLTDDDGETRGEALVGLARRQDERAILLIKTGLDSDDLPGLVLEAVEEMPRAAFVPRLRRLLKELPDDADVRSALDACLAAEHDAPAS